MAMSKCKECGKSISTLAKICPGCGAPNPTGKASSSKSKTENYKPKGAIQILAAIGLVIAILWTAKGLFQAGGAGYKEIKNKVSGGSGLPILKCVTDDNGKDFVDIIDLQKIKSEQGSWDRIKKKQKRPNVSFNWMQISDEDYTVYYISNKNGMRKGMINL